MSSKVPRVTDIVALIPAGGQAKRLQPLSCSKEIHPVGYCQSSKGINPRPKAVCEYLLENLTAAGITRAFIILRTEKWDIVDYFKDGTHFGINLAYLTTKLNNGVPYTLEQAYPYIRNDWVALGFPDIILEPVSVFSDVMQAANESNADVILGLFPVSDASKSDVVELNCDGRVTRVVPKPVQTTLEYTWLCAVWSPRFTEFMHTHTKSETEKLIKGSSAVSELYIGDLIQLAIEAGFYVKGKPLIHGRYIDIGTPDDLALAQQHYSCKS